MKGYVVLPPVLGLALGFCPQAHALGPVEVGGTVGAASNPISGGFPNSLGLGAGATAGVSIRGFYAGVGAEYYPGESGQLGQNGQLGSCPPKSCARFYGSMSVQSSLFGGELGFGIKRLHAAPRGERLRRRHLSARFGYRNAQGLAKREVLLACPEQKELPHLLAPGRVARPRLLGAQRLPCTLEVTT
jgi:hypothetical protein